MNRLSSRCFLVLTLLVASVPTAWACKCAQRDMKDVYNESRAIFTAEVIQTAPGTVRGYGFEGPGYRIYLRVIRTFKGPLRPGDKDVFATFIPGGSCGIPVVAGQQFLVYVYSEAESQNFLGRCNSSTGDQMIADITKLDTFIAERSGRRRGTKKAAQEQGSAG
jgi:hypothetical protein